VALGQALKFCMLIRICHRLSKETLRLCRGGSRSLTFPKVAGFWNPKVRPELIGRSDRSTATVNVAVLPREWARLRTGPFEGPAIGKPPALPEDA
jgi:hypothetical protein